MKLKEIALLLIRIAVAVILVQTLFFKFSRHPDSVYIFSKLGMEPYGRIGIGVLELIAAILIVLPRTVWMGAALSLGIISGALYFHLVKLGIVVNNDGGLLFGLAAIVFVLSAYILWAYRKQIPFLNLG